MVIYTSTEKDHCLILVWSPTIEGGHIYVDQSSFINVSHRVFFSSQPLCVHFPSICFFQVLVPSSSGFATFFKSLPLPLQHLPLPRFSSRYHFPYNTYLYHVLKIVTTTLTTPTFATFFKSLPLPLQYLPLPRFSSHYHYPYNTYLYHVFKVVTTTLTTPTFTTFLKSLPLTLQHLPLPRFSNSKGKR